MKSRHDRYYRKRMKIVRLYNKVLNFQMAKLFGNMELCSNPMFTVRPR